MSDSNQDEILSEFKTVTGIATDRAKFYLESANWNLQLALSSFYEGDPENDYDAESTTGETSSEPASQQPTLIPTPLFSSISDDQKKADKKNKSKNKYNVGGARVFTLNNMSSSEDDDDETSGQAFYAGGSERSGQQVLGPPRKNPSKDFVSEIFKSAKESGAEVVENPNSNAPGGSRSFSGTGYRLGQTSDDHVRFDTTSTSSSQNNDPIILRLWRQGFTINDSELRLYEEPINKEFLEYITRGQLPPELRQQGTMVQVHMEDHRHEDFKASAPKIKPFSGKGHTLGSPTPNMSATSIASAVQVPTVADNERDEQSAIEKLKLDSSQPTTSIQIRLADGSRLSGRFNLTHTIDDLRQYVINARPQYASQTFALLTTFPSKELTNSEQTIESAGLANAAIMQRLK